MVREFCLEKEKCLMGDPNKIVKNINIFYRLLVEVMNDFAQSITNRALFVMTVLIFATISAYRVYSKWFKNFQHKKSNSPIKKYCILEIKKNHKNKNINEGKKI